MTAALAGRTRHYAGVTAQASYEGDDAFLANLRGMEIAAVSFVRDYLRLQMEDDRRTGMFDFWVWPSVSVKGVNRRFDDPGYRDAMCDLMSRPVTGTHASPERGFVIEFDSDVLQLNPGPEDTIPVEIAMLSFGNDDGFMVWRPGEETFEHL